MTVSLRRLTRFSCAAFLLVLVFAACSGGTTADSGATASANGSDTLESVDEDTPAATELESAKPADTRSTGPILVSGASHLCVLNASGQADCWGSSGADGTPDTSFVSLGAGGRQSAGITDEGTLECWGDYADLCPNTRFVQVDPGYYHSCGLAADQTIECWADQAQADPQLVLPPSGSFASVTSGWFHSCALANSGLVTCWGEDSNGKLSPPADALFTEISAGRDFTCGLDTSQNIQCWGEPANDQGQANNMIGPFTQVSAGFYHSCGLTDQAAVSCQGRVFDEPTGPVTEPADPTTPPEGAFSLLPSKLGYAHGCAVNADTSIIECWGADYGGQISEAPTSPFTWETSADSTTSVSSATSSVIAAGARHTCALTIDQEIACWGREIMNGTYPLVASDVYGDETFLGAFRGTHQGIGILADGSTICWGEDDLDQCQDRPGPYLAVSGADKHACGILVDGILDCWGDSESLDFSTGFDGTFVQVASGYFHTCALDRTGHVSCWGCLSNDSGQCSTSSVDDLVFTEITSGRAYTCGLTAEGTVHCWGDDGEGQAPPVIDGPFATIGAGSFHGCGVLEGSRQVECWGRNDDGQASPPSGEFAHVTAGFTFSCGMTVDGTAECWGEDAEGFIEPPALIFATG